MPPPGPLRSQHCRRRGLTQPTSPSLGCRSRLDRRDDQVSAVSLRPLSTGAQLSLAILSASSCVGLLS